jgi:phosphoenolpyruvate-protein kinase (PTS system EI component)
MNNCTELRFQGQPVSSGIAMGRLRVEARGCSAPIIRTILPTEIEAEWQRFDTALERTELEIKVLKTRVEELSGANEAAIFDAHLLFLLNGATYETMNDIGMNRQERARLVRYLSAYYGQHMVNFPGLQSLVILQNLFFA